MRVLFFRNTDFRNVSQGQLADSSRVQGEAREGRHPVPEHVLAIILWRFDQKSRIPDCGIKSRIVEGEITDFSNTLIAHYEYSIG
jgi:hypothetical protein